VVNSRFAFFGRLLTEDMARPTEMSTLISTAAPNVVHPRVRPLFRHIADHSVRLLEGRNLSGEASEPAMRAISEAERWAITLAATAWFSQSKIGFDIGGG